MTKRPRDDPSPSGTVASPPTAKSSSPKRQPSTANNALTAEEVAIRGVPIGATDEDIVGFLRSLSFTRPLSTLHRHTTREPCPKCGKKRLHYCYDCLLPTSPAVFPPPLQLPVNVHVVLHPGEIRGKSTTLPASVVSPDVHIHVYDTNKPEKRAPMGGSGSTFDPFDLPPEETLLLYPAPGTPLLSDLPSVTQYKHLVVIDSTWQQSKSIAADDRIKRYATVSIPQRQTLFWRYQDKDESFLATIEAIYYVVKQYQYQQRTLARLALETSGRLNNDGVESSTEQAPSSQNRGAGSKASGSDPSPVSNLTASPPQGKGSTGGATIPENSNTNVDDLLYFFIHQYVSIQRRYATGAEYLAPVGRGNSDERSSAGPPATAAARSSTAGGAQSSGLKGTSGDSGSMTFTTRHRADYVRSGVDWNSFF